MPENMNVQTTTNTVGTTFINKTFFDKDLLEYSKKRLVYAKHGVRKPIPKGRGKKIEMRRWVPFDVAKALTPLTEGVTPDGLSLEQDIVEAVVEQYGAYFTYSDLLDLTTFDELVMSGNKRLGELMGDVKDHVTRDVVCSGDNVWYPGEITTRSAITATDVLTIDMVQRAVLELETLRAPKFQRDGQGEGFYKCIIHPKVKYDIWNDPKWEAANTYVQQTRLYSGEIGKIFGCVFIVSDNAPIIPITADGAVTNTVPVHQSVMFGDESYAVVDINGSGSIKSIIKEPGSAGAGDPLDQRGTVGAKITAFASAILNEDWVLRLEHAGSLK